MKICKQLFSFIMVVQLLLSISICNAFAEVEITQSTNVEFLDVIENAVGFIENTRNEEFLCKYNDDYDYDIIDCIEFVYDNSELLSYEIIELLDSIIEKASSYYYSVNCINNDDLSKFLLINSLQDESESIWLLNSQNPDGGFGLAKNYASDIIDTMILS